MPAWQMSSLIEALEPTAAEACLEIATGLTQIICAAGAADRVAASYETGSTYFELATTHGAWRVACRYHAGGYETVITMLGTLGAPFGLAFRSAAEASAYVNAVTIGLPVAESKALLSPEVASHPWPESMQQWVSQSEHISLDT